MVVTLLQLPHILLACCCWILIWLQTGLTGVTHIGANKDYSAVINAALAGTQCGYCPCWRHRVISCCCSWCIVFVRHTNLWLTTGDIPLTCTSVCLIAEEGFPANNMPDPEQLADEIRLDMQPAIYSLVV
jgi:hypothetical protein